MARPNRGWLFPADWTTLHSHLRCSRARVLAATGAKERALDDAIEALAVNLSGTEFDYARLVASAQPGLHTASLLVQGIEPDGDPLGW